MHVSREKLTLANELVLAGAASPRAQHFHSRVTPRAFHQGGEGRLTGAINSKAKVGARLSTTARRRTQDMVKELTDHLHLGRQERARLPGVRPP